MEDIKTQHLTDEERNKNINSALVLLELEIHKAKLEGKEEYANACRMVAEGIKKHKKQDLGKEEK